MQTYAPIRGMTVCAHGSGDYVKKDDVDVAIAKAAGKLASDLIGTSLKPGDPKIGELIDIILRAMRPEFFPLNNQDDTRSPNNP